MSATFSTNIIVLSSTTPPTLSSCPPTRRSAPHASRFSRPSWIRRNFNEIFLINEHLCVYHPRRPPVRIWNESPGRYSQSRDARREAARGICGHLYGGRIHEIPGVHPHTHTVWHPHLNDQSGNHTDFLVCRGFQLGGPVRSGAEHERHSHRSNLHRIASDCQGDSRDSLHDLFDVCDRAEIRI